MALNTFLCQSCGNLFQREYRNLFAHSLFNRDMTGVLRAARSKPEARTKPA